MIEIYAAMHWVFIYLLNIFKNKGRISCETCNAHYAHHSFKHAVAARSICIGEHTLHKIIFAKNFTLPKCPEVIFKENNV